MNSYAKFGGAARRHFSAICEKPMGGTHVPPRPCAGLSIAFSYKFEAKNISKIELEKWHFNTESYGLVVKVTPMLPYNFGPPVCMFHLHHLRTAQ